MIFRFAVIRTFDISVGKLRVCGSVPPLGNWDPSCALDLHPSDTCAPVGNAEPSFWSSDVELDASEAKNPYFLYKFVCVLKKNGSGEECYEWEGCGPQHDRLQHFDSQKVDNFVEENGRKVFLLSPVYWIEADGETNEKSHTTQFYYRSIADQNGIHFSKMEPSLYLGSCPRQFHHVATLKSLGISAVINFQTGEDIAQNSRGVVMQKKLSVDSRFKHKSNLVDDLAEIYRHHGMVYVWLPTEDMSTPGRLRTLPQAVFLLQGLLASGHSVYVHCNAGVGRANAAVCGFYHFVRKLSLKKTHYFVASKRPAVFMDLEALSKGKEDFVAKFGSASEALELECQKNFVKF